ncbi:MFS transporter [Nostoc sp.]
MLFTSVGLGKAQETNSISQPNNSNSGQTSPTTSSQQTRTQGAIITEVTSIKSISPRDFYVSIPQSIIPEDESRYSNEHINVVVTGDNFPKQDNSPQNKIEIKIGKFSNIATAIAKVAENRKAIYASFNNEQLAKLNTGKNPVIVEVGGNATDIDLQEANDKLEVMVERPVSAWTTLIVFIITAFCVFILLVIIYCLIRDAYSLTREAKKSNLSKSFSENNTKNLNLLEWFIVDVQTNTYSLARAQFIWWLTIIVFGYLFLLIGRGLFRRTWEFIPLSGFGYTFLISLATLVTAQATSEIRGNKGSGEVNPGWSDLVMHGGVVALERVQQIVWNLIIGVAFIVILLVTYPTASSFPTIPSELLALIGISATGYIGGKAIRKPGPNINQVVLYGPAKESNLPPDYISIAGANFSLGGKILNSEEKEEVNTQIKDAGVIVQMVYLDSTNNEIPKTLVEIKKDDIVTIKTDPDAPMEFCRRFKIPLKDLKRLPDNWLKEFSDHYDQGEVKIIIINADGQKAVWDGSIITPEREIPPPATEPEQSKSDA